MQRFTHESSKNRIKPLLSLTVFIAVFLLFAFSIGKASDKTSEKQTESLKLAISQSIAHCYAAEGRYPESLDYLKEHYGIHYDSDKYFVDYLVLGENIFPDVTIIEKQEAKP